MVSWLPNCSVSGSLEAVKRTDKTVLSALYVQPQTFYDRVCGGQGYGFRRPFQLGPQEDVFKVTLPGFDLNDRLVSWGICNLVLLNGVRCLPNFTKLLVCLFEVGHFSDKREFRGLWCDSKCAAKIVLISLLEQFRIVSRHGVGVILNDRGEELAVSGCV